MLVELHLILYRTYRLRDSGKSLVHCVLLRLIKLLLKCVIKAFIITLVGLVWQGTVVSSLCQGTVIITIAYGQSTAMRTPLIRTVVAAHAGVVIAFIQTGRV